MGITDSGARFAEEWRTGEDFAQWVGVSNEGKLVLVHWREESLAWRGRMGPSVDLWQGRASASHVALQPTKQRLQWRNGEDFAQWWWNE